MDSLADKFEKRMSGGGTPSLMFRTISHTSTGGHDTPRFLRRVDCLNEDNFNYMAANCLCEAIREKLSYNNYCKAVVGLSGGETPKNIYKIVNTMKSRIEWERVIIFLVDDRYVPHDHPDSNQLPIKEFLLKDVNIPEENLIFPDTSLPLDKCVAKYQKDLSVVFTLSGGADIVTLGMGMDGHVASWFAPLSKDDYQTAIDPNVLVAHTTTDTFAVKDRITVSLSLICAAQHKLVFLKGEDKVERWKEIQSMQNINACDYPIFAVMKSANITVVSFPPLYKREDDGAIRHLDESAHLSIVVLGASGDLAYKKTYPAIFSLFCEGYISGNFVVAGYARSKKSFDDFWVNIAKGLEPLNSYYTTKAKSFPSEGDNSDFMQEFKKHCIYLSGEYDKPECYEGLNSEIEQLAGEKKKKKNRIFYLAIPPSAFSSAVAAFKQSCWSSTGWNRVVVEKPFGHDLESSNVLSEQLMSVLKEDEVYRIDHYLGKEMVLNIMTLRFANLAFMPLFHRSFVKCVRITFKEDFGVEKRSGYFNQYGIIRDVMQNHMLQLLALVGMEQPPLNTDEDIRDEKVKLLKQIPPIELEETVLGQYTASDDHKAYTEESDIPPDSLCPTFCTCVLWVKNERWQGVPFIMKAGKALEKRVTEIRMQLQYAPGCMFGSGIPPNELVIQVQPNEAVYLKFVTKRPGFSTEMDETELDLSIRDRFQLERLPEAYERLLLDVIKGDKQNFVRSDELKHAWRIFTPLLHRIEKEKAKPIPYKFGSHGPNEAYELIQKYFNFKTDSTYRWEKKK